jgi:outer membrane protein OmpA-like peptidoglycan-associated protein
VLFRSIQADKAIAAGKEAGLKTLPVANAANDAGKQIVDSAATVAKSNMPTRIQVNGYTDTSGTKRYNLALSRRRADTVRAALIADGVSANAIQTAGYGEENLRVQTPNGVREPQNRRVEILMGAP